MSQLLVVIFLYSLAIKKGLTVVRNIIPYEAWVRIGLIWSWHRAESIILANCISSNDVDNGLSDSRSDTVYKIYTNQRVVFKSLDINSPPGGSSGVSSSL